MVVSAILLTALAPITGALFGASYGTSIRIGYEIIFPALFGDMINDQKNKKTSNSTEEGAKRTIKALHTMFTATGGASAMEFGIEQGIEMAKKKTESQDVQDMIDLNLGLSDKQINKRGKAFQFQDPIIEFEAEKKGIKENVQDFEAQNDFRGLTLPEITKIFLDAPMTELSTLLRLLQKEFGQTHIVVTRMKQLVAKRRGAVPSTQKVIEKKSTGNVKIIATMWNTMKTLLHKARTGPSKFKSKTLKQFLNNAKKYNRFVASIGKSNLQIDTARSLKALRLIPK